MVVVLVVQLVDDVEFVDTNQCIETLKALYRRHYFQQVAEETDRLLSINTRRGST